MRIILFFVFYTKYRTTILIPKLFAHKKQFKLIKFFYLFLSCFLGVTYRASIEINNHGN